METFSDSFDYILQLTKTLSSQCWNNRQETLKLEQLLKRLAKQTHISYEQFTNEPSAEASKIYDENAQLTEEERLVQENYQLVYQIEQQEYLNTRFWILIGQINELIVSIRNFIVEQRSIRPKAEAEFIERNVTECEEKLVTNQMRLLQAEENSTEAIAALLKELVQVCSEVNWSNVPRDSRSFQRLLQNMEKVQKVHNITLIPDI
ncbi:ADR125Wp [Eremothecium gossypii ATCC 10895]|uniref:ADR125Wp n=1 Tax=Eremothecium gossypii (strain ATCC 10895 / CBS 109.51 / FGSC 9923 / NRRL Y-1056) TaxID=284811 RepID=Q759Z8_EREGS|nr:ADR125Wp [Eremothecium gossypii ATCC 10895]AAS52045.2 ADR125Wp [Eremothecium gossypii ATCC 10895]